MSWRLYASTCSWTTLSGPGPFRALEAEQRHREHDEIGQSIEDARRVPEQLEGLLRRLPKQLRDCYRLGPDGNGEVDDITLCNVDPRRWVLGEDGAGRLRRIDGRSRLDDLDPTLGGQLLGLRERDPDEIREP